MSPINQPSGASQFHHKYNAHLILLRYIHTALYGADSSEGSLECCLRVLILQWLGALVNVVELAYGAVGSIDPLNDKRVACVGS